MNSGYFLRRKFPPETGNSGKIFRRENATEEIFQYDRICSTIINLKFLLKKKVFPGENLYWKFSGKIDGEKNKKYPVIFWRKL